ncbi:MAG: polymer-forming cytoskeletal protein [Spirochaetes bacterium]|nr:polymer-forming cytoskeletal protein [Spirochaetota bacterium]
MGKGDVINSVIGEGSVFEGKFYIQGSLEINGKFEGEIRTDNQIIIGETGKVRTNIIAKKVVVGGTLIGNIKADEEVLLLETGRILGDILTPILNLEKGVVIQGRIVITGGQKKETKKIVEESYSTGPVMPAMTRRVNGDKEGDKESGKASAKNKE